MKERIFEKYIELSNIIGTVNVTLSKLAKSLGMSKANLYTYFADKETLIFEMIDYKSSILLKKLTDIKTESGKPEDKLRSFINIHVRKALENENFLRVMHDIMRNRLVEDIERLCSMRNFENRIREVLENILIDGKQQGIFREEIDSGRLSSYILNMLRGIFVENNFFGKQRRIFFREDVEIYSEEIYSLILKGIKKQEDL